MKKKQTPHSTPAENLNLKEIQELIRMLSKSNISEVRIERGNYKLTLRTHDVNASSARYEMPAIQQMTPSASSVQMQPVPKPREIPASHPSAEPAEAAVDSKLVTIKSPMIGTFYRSASPDKPSFINVGDEIKQGQVLCIIEAMKLFNEIESEHSGWIVKILIDNASPVEYDQPLFLIEPV